MARLQCVLLCLLLSLTLINSQENLAPTFDVPLTVLQIDEEPPPNTEVGTVEATDLEGDLVMYYVEPGAINSDNFVVNGTSGIIRTTSRLDRESANQPLVLFVRATDGLVRGVPDAEIEVLIYLRDINDNAPQFSNLPAAVTFPENTGVSTTIFRVAATDPDSGRNSMVLYRIQSATSSGLFDININTGDITLSGSLNFDAPGGRMHIISVEAVDRGDTPQSTVRDLTLLVNDTNDLSPLFTQSQYFVEIHENLTFGASVVQVVAIDQDFGLNEPVMYAIISGNDLLGGEASFEINPLSGLIYVNVSSLDRETFAIYSLVVMATEIDDATKSDTSFVRITIFDVNDNSPSFEQPSYNTTIPESTAVGMSVLTVTAVDPDDGTHAEFSFSFEDLLNVSASLPFEISHDRLSGEGTISVNDPLDFETTRRYVFRVIATEEIDNQPRNGSTTVYVDITNTNDNNPVFDNTTYFSTVPENAAPGLFVVMVRATDNDLGTFGEVEYAIMSGHMDQFNITEDTGRVETTEELDFETTPSYTIRIRALDRDVDSPNLGVTDLEVMVENLNDNPPMFFSQGEMVEEVQVNVTEQQPAGTVVMMLEARDADGDLTPLSFEIINGNNLSHFQLNEATPPSPSRNVLVTTMMLDHDLGTRDYRLTVTVNDTENVAFLIINVQVVDINDNDPLFENATYNFTVCENLPAGSTVGVVTATDGDSGTFGEVRYSLSGPGIENFYINSTTGEIETTMVLNRELVGQFNLVATAADSDTNPVGRRSTTVPVTVTVLDKNDNPPVFDMSTYLFSVEENTEVVSSLSVRAQDMDVGDNGEVRYEIVSGNEAGTFIINNITGVINRNPTEQIDRESVAVYNLMVEARDGGDPQMNATAFIRIDILDQNDMSPQFPETQYNATIPEDIPSAGIVAQVVAVDGDTDGNGLLRYTITSTAGPTTPTTGRGGFVIDERTGTVETTGTFDREEFRGPYTIIILAQDGGFPIPRNGSTELLVYLSDINDEIPVFTAASYSQEISEGLLPHQLVAQLEARDNDLEDTPNSEVYFEITNVFATDEVGAFDPPLPLLDHFYVNTTSGEVFTNVSLDYEAIRSYRVVVTARDQGVPQRSSTTFVTVDVADINDEPPSFSAPSYTLRVGEDTSMNSQFEVVMATDEDEGTNAELTFAADSMAPFSVDPLSGNLVLTQTIDFETRNNYTLNVTVMDGGSPTLYDSALVNIYVEDVNDNRPSFNATSYSADILEANYSDSPMRIATVTAPDIDSGALGRVTYEIISGNVGGAFAIGNETGQVWAVGEVDKEAVDQYTLVILAEDGGVPPATSTAEVLVTVLDVNDNMPIFGRVEYVTSVQENTPSGESISRVTAIDQDEGSNGVVLFSITSTVFAIDEVTGVVTTATSFDYEMDQVFIIEVTARDNASFPLESRVNVIVNITDTNDLAPSFSSFPSPLTLAENVTVGTLVASVTASDGDSGTNGEVVYQLANDEGNFVIDALGNIILLVSLDREVTAVYNLTVMALDRGQPQRADTEYLTVTVGDINDETPEFSEDSYSFLVPEDVGSNSVVAMVTVTDLDTMMRGEVEFDLVGSGGDFTVTRRREDDAQTWIGEITTTTTLDYEMQTSYTLLIRATDQAPPGNENVANVTITILDTNDNAPQFSMPAGYTLRVPEEAPVSSPVGTIVATDSDGGRNGTVLYAFASGTNTTFTSTFSINQATGVITLQQSLDFETRMQYVFGVEAQDSSSVPMSSRVNVTVNVEDMNEHAPVFDMRNYSGSVLEGLVAGQFVLRVNATEPEIGLTSGISYSIVAGATDRFVINPSSGFITTNAVLDREEVPRYVLTVEARDMPPGTNSLASYVQVDITVRDQNDNTPDFGVPFFVYNIAENSAVGTVLAPTRLATDRDEGTNGEVRYSIRTGPFNVDEFTGVIRVSDSNLLNREVMPVFNLLLTATDRGTTRMASTIDIQVILGDMNDNSPEFGEQVYDTDVMENSTAGVSVIMVGATDLDDDGDIMYAIQSGDDVDAKFSITSLTGLIQTTSSPLDRETRASYTLTVIATDSGIPPNTGTTTVMVRLLDRNDEAPAFLNTPLVFSVEEPTDRQLFIADLQANDGDDGANADIMFFISFGNDQTVFTLNPGTGELFAEIGLDFETQTVYNLRVTAVDQAPNLSDRLSSTTTVTVNVIDVNDNTPEFSESTYETVVVENATAGETVLIVMAVDRDTGSNGEVTYHFQSPISGFSIDSRTGVITVSGVLDSETISMYTLTVEARDGGSTTRIGNANLIIRVININDNSPRFDRSFYVAEVAEDVPMDTTVATLTATDLDSPSSSLRYFITAGNDGGYFKINTMSGLIQTARSLDREQVPLYSLSVTAEDDGTPPGIGTTTLQVTITDVNDEQPEFLEPVYYASVPENSPQGTQVLPEVNGTTTRIEAIDPDQPDNQNSQVLYRLEGTNSDLFNIDFVTGIITVARGASLDRETTPLLTFTVVASDNVPPPNTRSSEVQLHISIADVNDVAPMFTEPFGYAFAFPENLPMGTQLTTDVMAVDPDSGAGGDITYTITDATPRDSMSRFNISGRTGAIALTQSLDRESTPLITLRVMARDQGVPLLSSVVSVQISVSDINDNPPEFSQSFYTTAVPEYHPTGASAFQLVAEDPDSSFNGEVHYAVLTTGEPFTINTDTGVLTTTATLDHETQDSHIIVVQACDRGTPRLCSNTTVSLTVEDFNDEAPRFDLVQYRVDVFEDTPADVILQPVATDRDSGTNAIIRYSLQGEMWSLFSINTSTGQISLDRPITPADIAMGTYSFTVVAEDSGPIALTGTANVIVRVLNSTEHPFRYTTSYFYYEIQERSRVFTSGGSTLLLGIVADTTTDFSADYTDNPFRLVTTSVLELKSDVDLMALGIGDTTGLDRERRDLYTVIIRGFSMPLGLDAYTSVTLRVLDMNDNNPEFINSVHLFTVSENQTAPVAVGTVLATDRDEGENARITYTIVPSTNVGDSFEIDSEGSLTTKRELDRETTSLYNLTVLAQDPSGVASSASVMVEVLDVNDEVPQFSEGTYNVAIIENMPSGASVAMVTATDGDDGANGMVRYSVIGGDVGVFQLDAVSGVITTRTTLDFEMEQTYQLRVQATDMGTPPQTSEVTVNIQVEDFNDCPPMFTNPPTSLSLLEDATSGSVLYTFEVSDCDSGLNGPNGTRFFIIAGNVDDHFAITAEGGVLYTRGTLDRETQASYLLSIQARDSAGANSLSSVTQVTVLVLDVNDNTPTFQESERQVFISVREGEDINQPLLTLTASDADDSINGDILYELTGHDGVFSIGATTGTISLATTADRETTDAYTLVVVARDRAAEPRSSNATVFVTILDENDNTPVIENIISGSTVQEVVENTVLGVQIFTVNATDRDAGVNGEVSYSLQDPSLPFAISPQGGVVSVISSLDYEATNEYTLVIRAVDGSAVRQLTGIATLTVRVLDANDNPPLFTETSYTGELLENVAPGAVLLAVTATDADQTGTANAIVTYSLVGGDTTVFDINSNTGVITNLVTLDREMQSRYYLTVLANNSQSHTQQSSDVIVDITVLDANDEVPMFQISRYTASISELTQTETSILEVSATDNDQEGTSNSELIFSLPRQTNNPFHLEQNTGVLSVQNPLDREAHPEPYELTAVVEDKGVPPQSSTAIITITLEDENDEPPIFGRNRYTVMVSELQPLYPFLLTTVNYSDPDTAFNNESEISIVTAGEGVDPSLFSVTTDVATGTGQVFLSQALDREERGAYSVQLQVANIRLGRGDNCGVSQSCQLSGTSTLEVIVVDENDNNPEFERAVYSGEISTTAQPGSSVLSVTATDRDSGNFGLVGYRLVNTADGRLRIDNITGTLFTRGSFSDLDGVMYSIVVTAYDNLGAVPSRSAQTTVNLVILNDFQRVRILFNVGIDTIVAKEERIMNVLRNISGLNIFVEDYADYSTEQQTNFIFHATDPATNQIVDFDDFFSRIGNREDELIAQLRDCDILEITSFADLETYVYPSPLDTQTIVILVLCGLLVLGSFIALFLALRQRYVALHDHRNKLLADVFYTPSMIDNINQEGLQLESLELQGQPMHRQNPMFVHPYDNWAGVDTSAVDSIGEVSSLKRDNPLYESQEIRMEMFADVSDEEDGEVDDAELLAAALQEDEEEEDPSVTAI